MYIKKGSILRIEHMRKGIFDCIADADFDTEQAAWYTVTLRETVEGLGTVWAKGRSISVGASLVKSLEVLEEAKPCEE